MNPWATSSDGDAGDAFGASHAAPTRASLGGLKAFVSRHRLEDANGLCIDTSAYSSTQLVERIDRLTQLKTISLQRVRELEQMEAQLATGGLLLPRQVVAKMEVVRSLRGDLEELLAMKSVLLRTLQKNVASEFLDLEMQHQRTFIDLFLKLSDELPRYAASAVATAVSTDRGNPTQSSSQGNMANDVRLRHKEYETAVAQCKATIAKFHLVRDDMARVRAAYSQLHQSTVSTTPAFAG